MVRRKELRAIPIQLRHCALAVLCLLRERAMHPYEMRLTLEGRRKSERLDLKPGSLYNAVKWLLECGFIEVASTESSGKRPQRTIYRLLPAGEGQIKAWMVEMLGEVGREVSPFSVALDHLVHLSPEEALALIEDRGEELGRTIESVSSGMKGLVERVGRINLIEREYDLSLYRAQKDWLSEFAHEIRSGRLQWDTEAILESVRTKEHSRKPNTKAIRRVGARRT